MSFKEIEQLDISLNRFVYDAEGNKIEAMDLLGNADEADFVRLKTFLLSICKNKTEQTIIELLSQEYSVHDVAKKLDYNIGSIQRIIREIRTRCLKQLKKKTQ